MPSGGPIRERLPTKAEHAAAPDESAAVGKLRTQLAALEDDLAAAERRIATERNDARSVAAAGRR